MFWPTVLCHNKLRAHLEPNGHGTTTWMHEDKYGAKSDPSLTPPLGYEVSVIERSKQARAQVRCGYTEHGKTEMQPRLVQILSQLQCTRAFGSIRPRQPHEWLARGPPVLQESGLLP